MHCQPPAITCHSPANYSQPPATTWHHLPCAANHPPSPATAESIHSLLKKRVAPKLSLYELVSIVIELNLRTRDSRIIDELRRKIKNKHSAAHLPPWIVDMQSQLTAYAFDLLLSQFCMCLEYTVNVCDAPCITMDHARDSSCKFKVSHPSQTEHGSVECPPIDSTTGLPSDYSCDSDIGLADHAQHRTCTLSTCSCLLPVSLGVPCRHILALHLALRVQGACKLPLCCSLVNHMLTICQRLL